MFTLTPCVESFLQAITPFADRRQLDGDVVGDLEQIGRLGSMSSDFTLTTSAETGPLTI